MTGRNLKMRAGLLAQAIYWGRARREEIAHRTGRRGSHRLSRRSRHVRKTPAGRLPYGLQKRVELARALAAEPSCCSLDEPMAGMNVEEKQDMCRFILDVNERVRRRRSC